MIFGGKSLAELTLADFRSLVDGRAAETSSLDYKRDPYDESGDKTREMLRDVVAMANAEGGYIVMGIAEVPGGRADKLTPFPQPDKAIQRMMQACLDGIDERIDGLQIQAFETDPGQGILVIRVPASSHRPHMVKREQRTDFVRRYGTDRRSMTLPEIRFAMLADPNFVEIAAREWERRAGKPSSERVYLHIVTDHPVEAFVNRYMLGGSQAEELIIVSPYISEMEEDRYSLADVLHRAEKDKSRVFVVTRPPKEEYHQKALDFLKAKPNVEIRYNPDVHAKLYICKVHEGNEAESFALFGSANLTSGGMTYNLELGMMILARGRGAAMVINLHDWFTNTLRATSKRIKPIK